MLNLQNLNEQITNEDELVNVLEEVESSSNRTSLMDDCREATSVTSEGKKEIDSREQLNTLSLESLIQVGLRLTSKVREI